MNRLPARIAAVMISTILVFVVTVGASVVWMSRALDGQAREQSVAQIREARNNLLDQMRLTTIDYAKWQAAVDEIDAVSMEWLHENIGTQAIVGQAIELFVVWGGRYEEDLGWATDAVEQGRPGLLDERTLELAESNLASVPIGVYEAPQFFAWREGSVYALSASRLEVVEDPNAAAAKDEELERLVMGRRLGEEELNEMAESFRLTGLGLVREAPAERPSVPLLGGDGEPIAHLAWEAPRPGATQLRWMLPPLLLVLTLIAGLAALGMALVRRSAEQLVTAEQEASVAALTDRLTGLPNRAAFNEALAAPARAGERGILFVDVNDFKRINDSIGHAAGDQVIIYVAQRLGNLARPDCLLARIGGDEFVLLVTGADAGARTKHLAEEAESTLARQFSVLGQEVRLKMAVGYAVQVTDDMSGDDLVRQADLAMYEAKRHKGGGPVAFSAMLEQATRDASRIEQSLRRALERPGELSLAYQPIVDMDGRMVRAEALARWTSPELGPVPPSRFIPVAEQAGLIVELGRQLLKLVYDDLVAHPDLRVSVNISPLHLMVPDFVPALVSKLEQHGIDASRVELEITEAVLVDNPRLAAERLDELHAAGFSTAIDDFGTGYSSVGYLRQLSFDTLKIDRSFVSEIHGSTEGADVVSGMVLMAHGFKLQVVCEGVETAEELDLLRDLGCDLTQGYHLDRPMAIGALAERWIGQAKGRSATA